MGPIKDISGQRFGRLIAVSKSHQNSKGEWYWLCICTCGLTKSVLGGKLRSGRTQSCGCLHADRMAEIKTTHGHTSKKNGNHPTGIYQIWSSMLKRCNNQNATNYARYGGRGISVCKQWHSFEFFLKDMGDRPFDGAQIDRIDNNGNYKPGNCRWVTPKENNRNTRRNKSIDTPSGKMPLFAAEEISGIPASVIRNRIYELKWPTERLFDPITPIGGDRRSKMFADKLTASWEK